ncbi:T9SS C-terminal target domain-containing protein [Runella sp. SP2]|nr:T9SS C-terminal target domain-containing protein [Runella sp. SP2]
MTGDLNGYTNGDVEYAIVSGGSFSGNPTFTSITAEPFIVATGTGTGVGTYTVRIRLKYNPDVFTDQTYTLTPKLTGTIYVKANASGVNNGSSWTDAFTSLQDALAAACSGAQIWVASGTYKPTADASGNTAPANARTKTFVMKNGVAIYGGFNGTETELSQRNWRTNATILSGNIGDTGIDTDNSYRVINNTFTSGSPLNNTAILDGFIVEKGYANGGFPLNLGGGMWNAYASPKIQNCVFRNNFAVSGGGVFNDNSSSSITNCLFLNNTVTTAGSGISNGGGTDMVKVINCTFYGNAGPTTIINERSATSISNSIVWGNGGGISGGTVTYCTVQGGVSGTGNISSDPRFENAVGGNFRLQQCSPGIDAGTNTNAPANDFAGNARPFNATGVSNTDMGAYEYQTTYDVCSACNNIAGGIVYVNASASGGSNNGSSWANAYTDLQSALTLARNYPSCVTQIWVAKGTYKPHASDPNVSFGMVNGVTIFGGFPNDGSGTMANRNQATNPTILSGDLNGDDTFTGTGTNLVIGNVSDNSYIIIRNGNTTDNTARLDGFIVSGGNNNNSPWGGGVLNDGSNGICNPVFVNCVFRHNIAEFGGAAVANYGENGTCNPTFTHCLFYQNQALFGGAMFCFNNVTITMNNCTFSQNKALVNGGAIHAGANAGSSILTLSNCILWDNAARSGGNQISVGNSTATLLLHYTLLQGGTGAIVDISSNNIINNGVLDANPLFVDAANGNFRLQQCSPAIDAGASMDAQTTDLDGNNRVDAVSGGGTVDIGAYEYQSTYEACTVCNNIAGGIVYVNASASGNNLGGSWANAFTDLQSALTLARTYPSCVSQIWVAAGTYKPTSGTDRAASLSMVNGVAIYGGFPNDGSGTMANRNWNTNPTILSGDIGTPNDDSDNSNNIFFNVGLNNSAVLDGFTLTKTNGVTFLNGYGAMVNENASPTVTNCIFTNNRASNGGGMANLNSSNPTVTHCNFTNNIAMNGGSAGGAVLFTRASGTFSNCQFISNSAPNSSGFAGGAIHIGGGAPRFTNCIFLGNSTSGRGGAIAISLNGSTNPIIFNCSFYNNSASNGGNGIYHSSNTSTFVSNSIFWDNSNEIAGTGTISINYSIVQGGYTGTGNINANPLFVDAANGNFRLQQCSPAIDAGTSTDAPTTDLDGNNRVDAVSGGGTVDIGAYEYQSTYDVCACISNNGIVYVNASASGGNNGRSWADAYTDLQSALSVARANPSCVTQIWVAAGTYKPTSGTDRGISFSMVSGVAIYGGFIGTETQLSARNWRNNPTLLSGNIGDTGIDTDNSYRVINNTFTSGAPLNNTAILDGFIVEKGYATGDFPFNLGGGMWNAYASPKVQNCVFRNNYATSGGGIFNDNSSSNITNCLFFNNTATTAGSGISNGGGTDMVQVVNCTFYGNTSSTTIINEKSATSISNSIVWGNSGGVSGGTVTYSNVQGGVDGTGNISSDPRFENAAGGDFRLQQCSPAIDAGTNTNAPASDFGSNARPFNATGVSNTDMGAYEYQTTYDVCSACNNIAGGIVYVNASASGGSNNGSSWANAYTDLQSALTLARNYPSCVTQIWVAAGTYKPTSGTDRGISFSMVNGVAIYGGFPNDGTGTMANRNWNTNPTILSGDIGAAEDSDNSYIVVVVGSGLNATAILDGFSVTGAAGADYGAGIYVNNSSPIITNCLLTRNSSTYFGGGLACNNSSPVVTNCTLSYNTSYYGGGMANAFGGVPIVTNCLFIHNNSTYFAGGGGLFSQLKSMTLTNCTFSGNSPKSIHCNIAINISNCVFLGSSLSFYNANASISNSIVEGGYDLCNNCPSGNGNANPLFVNVADGNFQLQACSPAINAGDPATTSATVGSLDLGGNPRFYNNGRVDIGAYEYQSAPPTAITPTVGTSNPTTCGGAEGSITLSGFLNNTTYSVTYKKNNVAVSAADFASNGSGVITLTGLGAGNYTEIVATYGVCVSNAVTASLEDPAKPSLTPGAIPVICADATSFTIPYSNPTGSPSKYSITGTGITTVSDGDLTNPITVQLSSPASGSSLPFTLTVKNSTTTCESDIIQGTVTVDPVSVGGSISGSATVCLGTNSTTLTLSGQVGNVQKWQSSLSSDFSSATDISNTTTELTASNLTQTTYYRAVVKSGVCSQANSASATVTVDPVSVGGSVSGSATVCSGTNSTTLTLSGQVGNVQKWQSSLSSDFSGAVDISNTTTELTASNLTQTTYYRSVVKSGVCSQANSVSATVTVEPVSVGGSVSGSATVCSGTNSTTLTLSGQVGNVQKWQSSLSSDFSGAVDISNTTTELTASNLTQTTYYRAVVKSGVCSQANSVSATVTVDPVSVGGGISGSATVCSGTNSTTLTLLGQVGNVQKWQSSLSSDFSGATDISNTTTELTASNLTQTTYYRAIVKSGVCSQANSVSATVTVDPVSVGGSISGSATVCSGTNSTTLTLSGQVGNVQKWQSSLSSDFSGAVDISNTTTELTASNLTQTTYYRVVVKSGVCSEATSTSATVTVNSVSVGGSVSGSATVCSGTNSTTLTLSGQVGNVQKWQSSLSSDFSGAVDISNTTTELTASNLTQTTYYRAVVKSGVCSQANSASATVTVDPVSVGGSISGSATVCSGTNSTTLTLSGQVGNVQKWQSSLSSDFSSAVDISNTTTELTASNLTQTTYYRTVVKSGVCSQANSVSATVTVDPVSVGGSISGSATVCSGTNSTTLTLSGQVGNVQKWQSSLSSDFSSATDISNTTTELTASNLTQTTYYRAVVKSGVCSQANSVSATVTVDPVSVGGSILGSATVCSGTNSTTLTLSGQVGNVQKWQSSLSSDFSSAVDISNTTTELTASNLTQTTYYRAIVKNGTCSQATSTLATVQVQSKPTIMLTTLQQTLNEGNSQVFCDTDANPVNGLQFTVSGLCVSGNPVWRVQVGSGAWSAWSANAPVSQSSNNQPHRYQAACDASCPVTYTNPIELTINYRASTPQNVSLVADGVSVNAGETKEVCNIEGNAITFNATCGVGEVFLYSVDGAEYSSTLPVQLVDGQYHNYRVRCRKSDGTVSCVETESGVMRLRIVSSSLVAPVASLNVTSGCGSPVTFSGITNCGALTTIWYNAVTNVALPSLPNQTPTETTSYYARCQAGGGCLSEKSNVVIYNVIPVGVAPAITASQDIVCTGTTVKISANCPAGSQTFWNTGVTASSFEVSFSNVTKQSYWAKCLFEGGCQSAESVRKDVYWNAFVVTLINIGESKSAVKVNDRSAWSSQFITRDGGPELEQSTQVNPTLYYVENANKQAPRYWTINVEACGLSTDGSLTFDMLATPEMGVIRSFNTHENNAPYFMYANREGWTELYAQNHPAYGFYQDNGAGGNSYDAGLPKGLYKLGIRYWDQKGWGSIYPSTRKPQGNVLAYQEYWFRIQSKDGVGVGAAREGANGSGQVVKGKEQWADNGKQITDNGVFANVMPNPVTHTLRLKVQESKWQVVQASLTDAAGREVLSRQFVPETNTHQEEFGVSELPTGMYFLKVTTSEKQATLKVVKVH